MQNKRNSSIRLMTDIAVKSSGDWSVNFSFNNCVVWTFRSMGYAVKQIKFNDAKHTVTLNLQEMSTGRDLTTSFPITEFAVGFTSMMETCLKEIIES